MDLCAHTVVAAGKFKGTLRRKFERSPVDVGGGLWGHVLIRKAVLEFSESLTVAVEEN